jgi:hypothetical protein
MTWLLLLLHLLCRVTAYALQDDALSTGELDYINGGKCDAMMMVILAKEK